MAIAQTNTLAAQAPAPRLSLARVSELPSSVARPGYDVAGVACGILHLGIGAFHRAHQAFYTDAALAGGETGWGIVGASLRAASVRDRLAPQNCLYTLVEKSGAGARRRVIGAVRDVIYAPEDRARLPALIADPRIRIVSLTVTEKGYCHDPASGRLNPAHPDIVHDLGEPQAPVSAIGILVAGLRQRRRAGAPITLLSCDNLPHNGAVLRGLVLDFAARLDPVAAQWIERAVAFPCSMVDRIVPATTDALIEETTAALGFADLAPVQCEPFSQWVVEDRFAAGRPAWDKAGAEMVADVAPFEEMKLRLLNGSHSMLAYLGYLSGFEYIWQVMRAPEYVALMREMMRAEVQPRLALNGRYDLATYQQTLIERFANPALAHRCYQIAMDGSQKLPQRLLGTIRVNLAAGLPIRRLALAVAAWMRYVGGIDERGNRIAVQDPLADELAARVARAGGDPGAIVDALLAVRAVFGDDLPASAPFKGELRAALASLFADGARATVQRYAAQQTNQGGRAP
ncbi:MAG TPA: mannitol dehydrogenase family protein [Xanthobacteraceae bacterium]|nr:mannitol dehydrogenase family protein [Xanthobacteraceae bacterium]